VLFRSRKLDLRQAFMTYDVISNYLDSHSGCGPLASRNKVTTKRNPKASPDGSPRRGPSYELLSGLFSNPSVETPRGSRPQPNPVVDNVSHNPSGGNRIEFCKAPTWPGRSQKTGYVVEIYGAGSDLQPPVRKSSASFAGSSSILYIEQKLSQSFHSADSRVEPPRTPLAMSLFESPHEAGDTDVVPTDFDDDKRAATALPDTAHPGAVTVGVAKTAKSFDSLKCAVNAAVTFLKGSSKNVQFSTSTEVSHNPVISNGNSTDVAGYDEDNAKPPFEGSDFENDLSSKRVHISSTYSGKASSRSSAVPGTLDRDSSSLWSATNAIESAVTWSAGMGRKADFFSMKIDSSVLQEVESLFQSANVDLLKLWDEAKITNEVEAGRLLSDLALTGLL